MGIKRNKTWTVELPTKELDDYLINLIGAYPRITFTEIIDKYSEQHGLAKKGKSKVRVINKISNKLRILEDKEKTEFIEGGYVLR